MKTLHFKKYSGNGNDFVILDNPKETITPGLLQKICSRPFGVGADGVLIFLDHPEFDGEMKIFNPDGAEADMCGNGLRCLVTYLDQKLKTKKNNYQIKTLKGVYHAHRNGDSFAIEMTEIGPKNKYDLSLFNKFQKSFFIETGVPHLVFLVEKLNEIKVKVEAPIYRHHALFSKGTNVNFVEVMDQGQKIARVRTFERGVEDETLSCGTGLTASALALQDWFDWSGEVKLQTPGGNHLVTLGEKIFFQGEVTFAFQGEFFL